MREKRHVKIFLAGGGSGGHVTPIVALAQAIKDAKLPWHIIYVGAKSDVFGQREVRAQVQLFAETHFLLAGKFRRFHNASGLKARVRLVAFLYNIRDLALVAAGILHSFYLVGRHRPQLVFSKGGYPALGPCLAAVVWRIPLVIHDSDAVSGLTHRVVRRWVHLRLTGLPVSQSSDQRLRHVGVPINQDFTKPLTPSQRQKLVKQYRLPPKPELVLVTGGGNGAKNLNRVVLETVDQLQLNRNTHIMMVTGTKFYDQAQAASRHVHRRHRLTVVDFVESMPDLMRLATVVVTRAGATALSEASVAGKPTIIVPQPFLPGAHQLHNAQIYRRARAALIVPDNGIKVNRKVFIQELESLLHNPKKRERLHHQILRLAAPDATAATLQALKSVLSKRRPGSPRKSRWADGASRAYLRNRSLSAYYTGSKDYRRRLAGLRKKQLLGHLLVLLTAILLMVTIYRFGYVTQVVIQVDTSSRLIGEQQIQELQRRASQLLRSLSHLERLTGAPARQIPIELNQEYEYTDEIKVDRDIWNSRLVMTVSPKEILGVFQSPNQQVLLTTEGQFLPQRGETADNSGLVVITAQPQLLAQLDPADDSSLLVGADLKFISALITYLAEESYPVQSIEIAGWPWETRLQLAGYNFQVIALSVNDPIKQGIAIIKALEFFDENEADYPEEYLDLRLLDRAAYR